MLKLKFDIRDLFRAPRLAFSLQRMWIQLVGMTIGYVFYFVLTYLSLNLGGFSLKIAWAQHGLLPCLFSTGEAFPWYCWIITGLGIAILFIAFLITNTAVSRAIYMTAKGNTFYTWRESFAFAFRKAGAVILTPIALIILIGLLILGALVIGLLGKIPFVGELGVSLFTVLWFLAALVLFFFAIVAVIATILAPSIIATTDEDAFEAVFQSFSVSWGQPWRFILYEALTIVLSFLALGIFAFFVKEAVYIMNSLIASFMGADFVNLANNGQAMLQSWTLMAENIIRAVYRDCSPLIFFTRKFVMIPAADLPTTVVISSYFYAFSLLFIAGWVLSYAISTFTAGNTLLFIVLKQKKDEENLLERKDKEEEEEEEAEEEKEKETSSEEDKPEDDSEEKEKPDKDSESK